MEKQTFLRERSAAEVLRSGRGETHPSLRTRKKRPREGGAFPPLSPGRPGKDLLLCGKEHIVYVELRAFSHCLDHENMIFIQVSGAGEFELESLPLSLGVRGELVDAFRGERLPFRRITEHGKI